ncbi:MAG TPA: hypothetical protein VJZ76_11865 [Thermoanaerobaculia bacterium]|nr:hypothetical protein [Thermoanaerobaculia bacterium]
MRIPVAVAVLFVSLSASAEGLRVFNPTESAARVAIACEDATVERLLAPHAIDDVDGHGCTAASAAPLLILQTGTTAEGIEWQRLAAPNADNCPSTVPLMLPSSGCRFGSAVVAVDPVPGASYSWSIDGGSFLAGAGTERVTIALEGGDSAKVSVAIAAPGCTQSAAGVIALHDSFQVTKLDPGAGLLGQSRTITWSYANGTPTSQILTGSDFGSVTLPADARSYSYVPASEGDKSVVLQARTGPAPAGARRRASGKGTAAASDCNAVRASAAFHVDCAPPDATIVAPSATNADTAFTARVNLDATATASWTIVNATPAIATGSSVSIKPAGLAPVDIIVNIVAGNCSAKGTKRVNVDGTLACDNPTVSVSVVRNDCNETSVNARFTGRPPFNGTWSDGQQFTTNDRSLQRSVSAAGNISVTSFSDAACAGTASNVVAVVPKIVKATLTAPNGACGGNTIVATFVGSPPFTGTWSDGVAFQSESTQLTRTAAKAGPLSLEFRDSSCPFTQSSNTLAVDDGTVTVSFDKSSSTACASFVTLDADVSGGTPPFSITWSDGVTQSQPTGSALTHFTHTFSVPLPSGAFGVKSAKDPVCSLKLAAPTMLSATGKPSSQFYTGGTYCSGTNATATLWTDPGPNGSIDWTVTNGSVVSGQGTRALTFTGTPGTVTVVCHISTGAGCVDAYSQTMTWYGPPAVPKISLSGDAVAPGTAVAISWPYDVNAQRTTVTVGTQTLSWGCGQTCGATYLAKSSGTYTVTVSQTPRCGGSAVNGTATLTVLP